MNLETLGRYRILGELGRGAMGTVYRALDPLIEREVAIKTLSAALPEEALAEVRERFLREAKSAGRLNHPNVVTVYDVGEHEGLAYIAMELLEGQSLQKILKHGERLAFDTVADIAAQVAEGLDHAQRFAIVHRDVKPANIMVSATGHTKLTDFGVAYVPSSTMTQAGTALGSPKYMAPEQVIGLPVDPRADVFSLGVVLYEMLVGKTPFERTSDTTIFALMDRIARAQHQPVTEINRAIPAAFDEILRRALAKKSEDRYQRAGEMANDLRRLRSGGAPANSPPPADITVISNRATFLGEDPRERTVEMPVFNEQTNIGLINDMERFARSFEEQERDRMREEAEASQRKAEELHRWAETQAKLREEFERQQEADNPVARRSSALELLRKQATVGPSSASDSRARALQAASRLHQRLRAMFKFFAQIAAEVNGAHPVYGRPYKVLYVGEITEAVLSDAFADSRSRNVLDKEMLDYVSLRYKLGPVTPLRVEVMAQDATQFRDLLNRYGLRHEPVSARSTAGAMNKAMFALAHVPCEARLQADYDDQEIVVELRNVIQLGNAGCRIKLEEFTDEVLDELSSYLLGFSDQFGERLKRR
jgi:serine/threonine protein kinase